MLSAPSSPSPSVSSASSSVATLSPSARERIAANKRLAQQKLAARDKELQQQRTLFRQYLSNGSPAQQYSLSPSPPPPKAAATVSARDVIVLDDDEDNSHNRRAARPLFLTDSDSRRRVERVQLTEAEREDRRFDDDDHCDNGDDGDIDSDVQLQQPRAPHNSSSRQPQLPAAAVPHVPPSARIAVSGGSSITTVSSRQGGSDHYRQYRSKDIAESSFTTLAPLPHSYRDAQPATSTPPLQWTASTQPHNNNNNPFVSTALTHRVSLTSADAARPTSSYASSTAPSLASGMTQSSHRAAVPHVPPHRQHEMQSEEEKQIWAMFDKARHPSHHTQRTSTATSAPRTAASTSSHSTYSQQHSGESTSNGSGVRKIPAVFDSVAFRMEERQDRERKRKKNMHPLLEERRNAKRLRVPTGAPSSNVTSPSPAHSHSSSSSRFSNPPPPSAPRYSSTAAPPALPRTHRKTQLLVDPRVAAAEKAREQRQQRLNHERLTAQRLKPSLDELHSTILTWPPLALGSTVRASLESRFERVPLSFADDVEYQTVFYPLLLEECRAEMMASMEELEMAQDERAAEHSTFNPRGLLEVVRIVSYEKVNAFHHIAVDRVDFDGNKRPSIFTSDDLVLLWYRPSAADPFEANEWKTASLHTLARLERVHDKEDSNTAGGGNKATERRKPGVHYKLQVHVELTGTGSGGGGEGGVDGKKLLQFLLRSGSQWGVVKVMTLITIHRQYRALQSCHLLSLFPFLMQPPSSSTRDKSGGSPNALSVLRQFPSELIRSFNPSQREAMATAMAATDGITLIQGPPGTGKTKTIVGLINLLLLQPPDATKPASTQSSHSATSSHSSSLSSPRSDGTSMNGRILICAPSNAAIDEIVARLLQPEALIDRAGKSLRASIVRVGAGRRPVGKDVVQAQHSGVDIDAVSLDRLVEERMKRNESRSVRDEEAEEGEMRDDVKEAQKEDSVADYDRALDRIRAQLDDVHARITTLEEKKHAPDEIAVDGSEKDNDKCPKAADSEKQREDVPQLLDAAHKQRKVLLAERKHIHGTKDFLLQRQRRRHQLNIDNREALRLSILNESHIVCTTLTGAGLDLFSQSTAPFDCVVIDEAAQAIEIQTLIPLKYECKRCVMVGDDRQLSATVISQTATRYEYQQSLFSRLRKCGVSVKVIQIQYRMHPHIRVFPSTFFYHSQLRDAPSLLSSHVVRRHVGLLHPLDSVGMSKNYVDKRIAPFVLYDVKGVESRAGHASLHNVMEAKVATRVFLLLYTAAQRAHSAVSSSAFPVAEFISDVGVITPYKQQVNTLRQHFRALFSHHPTLSPTLLAQLEISTVDSFQGREKSHILFSAVRAHTTGSGIGFVADANRLNVALTRARQCLAVLGSARTLCREEIWAALIGDARERRCVVEVDDMAAVFDDRLHSERWRVPLDPSMWGDGESGDSDASDSATVVDRAERRGSLSSGSDGSGGTEQQRGKLMMGERKDSNGGLVRRLSNDRLNKAAAVGGEGITRTSSGQRQASDERRDKGIGSNNRIPRVNTSK